MRTIRLNIALAVAVFATGLYAHADTVALTSFTGGSPFQSVDANPNTIGWQFTANSNITVTSLGIFNPSSFGDPLANSHEVGLWDSGGNLLAEVTVAPTGSTIDGFYFDSVTPVNLTAGDTYTLGALISLNDFYITGTTTRTTSSDITYLQGVFIDGSTLTDPGSSGGVSGGRFGPNFTFVETSTSPVPEPSSIVLLGMGLLGVVGAARRRLA